jgi:hypothetical protein
MGPSVLAQERLSLTRERRKLADATNVMQAERVSRSKHERPEATRSLARAAMAVARKPGAVVRLAFAGDG